MADEILKCEKIINEDDSTRQYEFSYRIENAGKTNTFCVVVLAADMENPASESEARTKANAQASVIKAQWIAQEITTSVDVSFLAGNVTL